VPLSRTEAQLLYGLVQTIQLGASRVRPCRSSCFHHAALAPCASPSDCGGKLGKKKKKTWCALNDVPRNTISNGRTPISSMYLMLEYDKACKSLWELCQADALRDRHPIIEAAEVASQHGTDLLETGENISSSYFAQIGPDLFPPAEPVHSVHTHIGVRQ
jgi:hypothetical protein